MILRTAILCLIRLSTWTNPALAVANSDCQRT